MNYSDAHPEVNLVALIRRIVIRKESGPIKKEATASK